MSYEIIIISMTCHVKPGQMVDGFGCGSLVSRVECFMFGFVDCMFVIYVQYVVCEPRHVLPRCYLSLVEQMNVLTHPIFLWDVMYGR